MFAKKLISLDIGSQNIKIVVGKCQKNKVYIDKTVMVDTPLHAVEDGNIVDKIRLREEIKNALGINNINVKDAICTTNSNLIINREIVIPEAEEDELLTMIKFEIQQYLPIVMDNYIVQYNVIENIEGEEEQVPNKVRALAVVYPKHVAEEYLSLLEDANLKAHSLDVNFNSINKLLKDDVDINGEQYIVNETNANINISEYTIEPINKSSICETVAFIDMGAESISINIYCEGQMCFSKIIPSGGSDIDKIAAREYEVTLEQAEKRKKEFCDLMKENDQHSMEEFNALIKETLNKWIEEIVRIFKYYKNKNVGNKIDKIYIYGGSSRLKGLEAYMTEFLNIKVERIISMGNIVCGKNADKNELDYYLNAIGAIIRL